MRKADRSRNSHRSEAEDAAPVSRAVADVAVVSLAAGDAAAVAGVAVVDVAVVDGVRRPLMRLPKTWLQQILAAMLCVGAAQAAPPSAPETQRSFTSAEQAVGAFIAALRNDQEADLRAILGPDANRVLHSGDRYADRELHKRFLALYDEKHTIDQKNPERAELDVGPDDWPLPIPLVQNNGRWTFDTKAGAQTIIDRRIGRNELTAIRTLLASVDAQRDYFERVKQTTGSGEFATRMLSAPGRRDGLYWPVSEGEPESPLGPEVDAAQDAGYPGPLVSGLPYGGYYFRILKAQGPNAEGGAKTYMQSNRMVGGFALIAWPAAFDSSGIMTFIVGPDGDVYQKDLGPETASIAAKMTTYDPDITWSRITMTNE